VLNAKSTVRRRLLGVALIVVERFARIVVTRFREGTAARR